MNDEESLWASPAVIIERLRMLGTFQRNVTHTETYESMQKLTQELKDILRENMN